MSRVRELVAFVPGLALLIPVSLGPILLMGACSQRTTGGGECRSNADCPDDTVCVVGVGETDGLCVTPDEDPGALPDPGGGGGGPGVWIPRDVDILFVIDNSGSMGEEQALLVDNFAAFIDVLESPDVEANYRIGITTTDNGNPWCQPTTPEAGKLVASPCTSRLGDFLFGQDVDVQDLACNDVCNLSAAELEIQPTTTDVDANPKPRPWLESIERQTNLPAGTSMADAFACYGPQGVNGCGFESPLESMYLALVRSQTADEDSYGFLRANAILAIVFVTDEADCSYNKDYAAIFEPDGGKVFWSDPAAALPTSAVCWNAGVECSGDPSNYSACDPVNKDVAGNSGVSDADAVLHPMSRYLGLVQGLEDEKKQYDASNEVIVGLIGGVSADGSIVYADSLSDPAYQDSYGIGPGCVADNPLDPNNPFTAVPPVRLREMVGAFTPDNLFSICEPDYSPALEAIASRIRAQIRPACFTKCVADTDPETALVEPVCTVEETQPGSEAATMAECLRDPSGAYVIDPATGDYAMPADDVNVCYALLVDNTGLTPSTADDMSPECVDGNFNLEFKLSRRPGFPAPGGTSISAACELAEFPDISCPGIGG